MPHTSTFTVVGHSKCPKCKQALMMIAGKGGSIIYKDAHQDQHQELVAELRKEHGSVPVIWQNDVLIGSFEKLQQVLA